MPVVAPFAGWREADARDRDLQVEPQALGGQTCVVGRGIKCCPLIGRFFFTGHLGPARAAGPFYFGRGVFLGSVTLEMYKEFHHQASVTERPVAL